VTFEGSEGREVAREKRPHQKSLSPDFWLLKYLNIDLQKFEV